MPDTGSRPVQDEPGSETTFHVRRAIGGDQESLEWVVERLSPLLLAHAQYRLGSVLRTICDPEDLVNEAWLVALPRFHDLIPRDGRLTPVLLRFLSTTVRHRIRSLVRRQAAGGPLRAGADLAEATQDLLAHVPAAQSGVVSRAVRHEFVDDVRAAIDELDEPDREVVLLRGIEQLPNATVAVLMESSVEAVSKRYRRALARLRKRLPGSVFDEIDGD